MFAIHDISTIKVLIMAIVSASEASLDAFSPKARAHNNHNFFISSYYLWWRMRASNPPDDLIASEVSTTSRPIPR